MPASGGPLEDRWCYVCRGGHSTLATSVVVAGTSRREGAAQRRQLLCAVRIDYMCVDKTFLITMEMLLLPEHARAHFRRL